MKVSGIRFRAIINLGTLFALVSLPALAKQESGLPAFPGLKVKCSKEIASTLTEWESANHWIPAAPIQLDQKLFRSPTAQLGTWVQLQGFSSGEMRAFRTTPHTQLEVRWGRTDCLPQISWSTSTLFSAENPADFTDKSLKRILSDRSGAGVIFLWSPHMPYSLDAVKNIRKAAQATGTQLRMVLDSQASPSAAKEAAAKFTIPEEGLGRNRSVELTFRGMELHFPSVVVYSQGKISSPMLPGLATAELYEKFIRDHLKP